MDFGSNAATEFVIKIGTEKGEILCQSAEAIR